MRPIIVLKQQHYEKLTDDILVCSGHGEPTPLRRFVTPAPSALDPTRGEEDDLVTVRLAQHYCCPFVSNDKYRSWQHKVSSSLQLWLQKAKTLGLRIEFTFCVGAGLRPEPPYPFGIVRRLRQQLIERQQRPRPELPAAEKEPRVRIFVRLLLAPPACELELPSSSTVGTLHAAVAAKLDLSYDLFLYGADGVPLDHWDAPLHRAFKYHASERKGGGTAQGVVLPETLYALPVYKAGLRRTQGTVAFGGLTSNFSAASYPLLAGGWSLQTEAGMSAACSALYVLKDCSPEVRERVVAGVSRVAATRMRVRHQSRRPSSACASESYFVRVRRGPCSPGFCPQPRSCLRVTRPSSPVI